MEEIPSLIEIGPVISGMEAARHDFSIARILATRYCVLGLSKDTLEEIRWNLSSWRWCLSRVERKAVEDDKLCSPLSWIPGKTRLKNNFKKGDMSKPRKVHYKTEWKRTQDAVYCIHLAKAQDKGITFWQTESNVSIAYKSVSPDCIDGVMYQKGETT